MTKARDIASAAPAPSTVSTTELGYLDGVTSAIQTQIDGKQAANAAVSTTELGYLDGVTSAIQTQLDAKVAKSLIDAKGDLIVGSANDTPAILSVGTNDYVLTADSTATNGVKWAAAASGASFVGCALYLTTSQSYTANNDVIVNWDNEHYDTDGFHSNTTNNSRITIPSGKGGKYRFFYHGIVTSYSSSNYITVGYYLNGSADRYIVNYPNTSWSEAYHQGEYIINLSAGDYVEVAINQASGSTKSMNTTSYYRQRFYCQYLGA